MIPPQSVTINFAQGLDTKTDPFQVLPGKFLSLQNTIFTKGGLLQKRNGFLSLASLPDGSNRFLTTFNGNLTAIGNSVNALSAGNNKWLNQGSLQPVQLSVLPLIRTNSNQTQVDTALAANGTVCTVYTDTISSASSSVTNVYRYVIADQTTGQNIVAPTAVISSAFAINYAPKVFSLGNYFTVVFAATPVGGGGSHLQYFAISQSTPTSVSSVTDLSTSFSPNSSQGSFDGVVANNSLYLSWNGASLSGLKTTSLSSTLGQGTTAVIASNSASIVGMGADTTVSPSNIWTTTYINGSNTGNIIATNSGLTTLFAAKQIINSSTASVLNMTVNAQNRTANIYYEVACSYTFSLTSTNFVNNLTCTNTGSLSATSTLVRSVGLGSKAFIVNGESYFIGTYSSPYQPSYFLINSTGAVASRIAYQNGGGYITAGLPSVNVVGSGSGQVAKFPYLFKDVIQAVNKDTNVPSGTQTAGIYSQTGINLASLKFTSDLLMSSEIGSNLNMTGGFLWNYDGYQVTENNFLLYPEGGLVTTGAAGNMIPQQYFYQMTYEWSDNQGNLYRSAPSIPLSITIASGQSAATIYIPALRITNKTKNQAKLVLYRWSTAQQNYYQVTSISNPLFNDKTQDALTVTDTSSDATILGNNLIYTTGGVVENTSGPPCNALTLFGSRLWLIDAEDPNLLWYSKQVIESTPVEMSDLFTIFIAPTTGAQGSTGPSRAIFSMDDKLLVFKSNAIYYITGSGPDNTGSNNQFSDPIFITGTVGCANQKSLVLIPQGVMFQSDKGIWLLGRDLNTSYIGAPVEQFNQYTVTSAVVIPGTNQVRFTLSNGQMIMYDYFFGQWGTFTNTPAISSSLYQNLHTFINSSGLVFQESPNSYLDGSNPVLISFVTSWFNLAGLQGFERVKAFYMLATYLSPHKLNVSVAYDYNSSATQSDIILPDNFSGVYGSDTIYGGGNPYGGQPTKEQWRVFLQQQKCQSFQITVQELFDTSLGTIPGAGLTISGIDLIVKLKSQYPRLSPGKSVG